jgi:Zn finger protein HypA/HybF involved in hydrogenase expression
VLGMKQINFIEKSKDIHGGKFYYHKCNFIKMDSKVILTCKVHGDFETWPRGHIHQKVGCPDCSKKNTTLNTVKVIELFKTLGHNYDYSKFEYISSTKKSTITCLEHGDFKQSYNHHYKQKQGCPKCGREKVNESINSRKLSNDEFIKRSNLIHGDVYDYTNTIYIKYNYKLNIICRIHGNFIQSPNSHLRGEGCPECNNSKGEKYVEKYLKEKNIEYIYQYRFPDCKNIRLLPFDFYIPYLNTCIEFDGKQHYEPVKLFGGEEGFKYTKINDNIKTTYCITNNIKLIRIKYSDYKIINNILKEKLCV